MKHRFKVGDIVRILPEFRAAQFYDDKDAVREVIYVDETDDELPYQLDGDNDFRQCWWGEEMLERYETSD